MRPLASARVDFVGRECCEHSFAARESGRLLQGIRLGHVEQCSEAHYGFEIGVWNWMNTAEKTPGNKNFCRSIDTATYSSMTQPWCFPLHDISTPTVCGVGLCSTAERNFGDEADDSTLTVKAKDCNCADQFYRSTLTTRDTSVTSLTQLSGKNQSSSELRHPGCRNCGGSDEDGGTDETSH